jgi:hypothetical protein
MQLKALYTVLLLAGLFIIGPRFSLEAKHHNQFSFNVGPVVTNYPRTYIVERYPPAYVEQHYYSPYGETVTVYHQPRPIIREVRQYPQHPFFSGFSFGFNFR